MSLTERRLGELKVRYSDIFFSGYLYYDNTHQLISQYPEIYKYLREEYREYKPFIEIAMKYEENVEYVPKYELIYALERFANIHERFPKDTDYEYFISGCENLLNYMNCYPHHIRENKELLLKMIENQTNSITLELPDKFLDDKDIIRKIIEKELDITSIGDDIKKDREFIMSVMEYDSQVLKLFDLSILSRDDIKNIVTFYPERIGLFPKLKGMCLKYLSEDKIAYYDCGIYKDDWDVVKYMISKNHQFNHDHLNNKIFINYCIPLTESKYFNDWNVEHIEFYREYIDELKDEDMMRLLTYCPVGIILNKYTHNPCEYLFIKGRNKGSQCIESGTLNSDTLLYECRKHKDKVKYTRKNTDEYLYDDQFWLNILCKNRGILKYLYIENKEIEWGGYKRIRQIKNDIVFHHY